MIVLSRFRTTSYWPCVERDAQFSYIFRSTRETQRRNQATLVRSTVLPGTGEASSKIIAEDGFKELERIAVNYFFFQPSGSVRTFTI